MIAPLSSTMRTASGRGLATRAFSTSPVARLAMPVTNAPTSAYAKEKGANGKYLVTLIPGDGIGPEVRG